MTARHFRFAVLGALIGLVAAMAPGCSKKCGPDTCGGGCCDANGACVTATSAGQCGVMGATCAACPTGQACNDGVCNGGSGGGSGGGTGTGGGGGDVDAGPPPCRSDFDCANGKICNPADGTCVMGQSCSADYQCQSLDSEDRCYRYGTQCTCDTAGGGICRLRKGPCEECKTDQECGSDAVIFGPPDGIGAGRCKALPNDMSGKKYCLYQRVGQCACGTVDDGTGFCAPQSNSCSQVGCNVDRQCGSGSVCTVNQPDAGAGTCGGVCVPRCRWDFENHRTLEPGCPPTQTCWVDSANLRSDSLFYGSGRCRPACSDNSECQFSPANTFGGPNLKCAAEKLSDGTDSPKRCRANGECMDTLECPELDAGQPNLGYCDRDTFACRTDCRTGADPLSNLPFKDCKPPYSCASMAGQNYCRLETCAEQGGAGIACAQGEYCCGDDRNFDGVADPCPPTTMQDPAGCFKAPTPPFCSTCAASTPFNMGVDSATQAAADQECANLMIPSWATCSDGGHSPNCSPLRPSCQYAGDKGMATGVNVCMWPSVNDIGTVNLRYGPTAKSQIACPTNYTVTFVRPQPNPMQDVGYCQTNADCSVLPDGGVSDAGICEPDPTLKLQDGGLLKSCRCDAKSGARQCPNGTAPIGQVSSFCKDAVTGSRSYCIETAVCTPPRNSVYKPVNEYGCGL